MIKKTLISLNEWEETIIDDLYLSDTKSKEIADLLSKKGILTITELKRGLEIKSNSYVGKIIIGDIQINVKPKIKGMPLYKLLRYAYGLRDLKLFNIAEHTIESFSFFDLIIYELYIEAEDLLRRGVQKTYLEQEKDLISPRGRININRLCAQGGLINNTLPCRYYNRDDNNLLNKILLAGLKLGANMASDKALIVKLQRLCAFLEEEVEELVLTRASLKQAKNCINRLTQRYTATLEIINILFESQGLYLEDGNNHIKLKGYFFDINSFFEALVGRLLQNVDGAYTIKDQFNLKDMFMYTPGFNPRNKRSPTPRPDFALMKNAKVVKLLDAKYRDLWEKSLPRDMLYQLAIYAVSELGDKTATIIYPSMNDTPSIQKIDIKNPVNSTNLASVVLKPLNLIKLAELINDDANLTALANDLIEEVDKKNSTSQKFLSII